MPTCKGIRCVENGLFARVSASVEGMLQAAEDKTLQDELDLLSVWAGATSNSLKAAGREVVVTKGSRRTCIRRERDASLRGRADYTCCDQRGAGDVFFAAYPQRADRTEADAVVRTAARLSAEQVENFLGKYFSAASLIQISTLRRARHRQSAACAPRC